MKKILFIVVGLALLVTLGFFIKSQFFSSNQGISGIIDLNGIPPEGSLIMISQKTANSQNNYVVFSDDINAKDGTPWQFSNAEKGKSYEIQAALIVNNNVITQSSPIFVTSPATGEALVLNVTSEQLVAAAIATPTPGGNSIISGNIGVNGYIPQGATITVKGRSLGKTTYTTVASNLPAVDNQIMTYTTAVAGQTYEVQGFLSDSNGNQIGSSNVITITAPANNEVLNINSTAQAPVTPTPTPMPQATNAPTTQPTASVISGSINFNGQAPTNSRIVIFQRISGTAQFNLAVDNISPANGSTWNWNAAISGNSYDLIAILKQRQSNGTDTDIADSNIITVASPASNEVFNINSGFSLPQASGSITVNCTDYNNGNQTWQANVSYQNITGAASYWFQIGITNGGIELSNSTYNASNNTAQVQTYTYPFQNNTTYYARYAYATVPNLMANSPQFSPLSGTQALRCSQ